MNIHIEDLQSLHQQPFTDAYLKGDEKATSCFHYSPFVQQSYVSRYEELMGRHFDRKKLSSAIREFMQPWGMTNQVQQSLHDLEDDRSVVVIGGQQAGLLLGPLYTIYKALTILTLAKQQQEKLGKPVIPMFWIAGEDHDFDEINHLFVPKGKGSQLHKLSIEENKDQEKWSVAQRTISQEQMLEWIRHFFASQAQTEFSEGMRNQMEQLLNKSNTYVDFFTALMHDCFASYGLLMIDSADQHLREQGSPVFKQIIESADQIHACARESVKSMKKNGFEAQLQMGEQPSLLFVYEGHQRLLLEKKADGFTTKNGRYSYSTEQLLHMANEEPWRLSNHVITRPFMQERLIPTLAFIGGPSEIAYWGLLRTYFEHMNVKMPIVMPRLSMTIVEKPIAKVMDKRALSLHQVMNGMDDVKTHWLREQDHLLFDERFDQARSNIRDSYMPIINLAASIEKGLADLGQKNLEKIMEQVDYFNKRTEQAFRQQHEAALRQFDKVEQSLLPHGDFQERKHNAYTFMNRHGSEWIHALLDQDWLINGRHKMVFLHDNA